MCKERTLPCHHVISDDDGEAQSFDDGVGELNLGRRLVLEVLPDTSYAGCV